MVVEEVAEGVMGGNGEEGRVQEEEEEEEAEEGMMEETTKVPILAPDYKMMMGML